VTYQWYDINDYVFYTEQEDKKSCIKIVVYVLILMLLWVKIKIYTIIKYKRFGSLNFTISRFLFSVATRLIQLRVLYKTNMSSLMLTLTVKDISQTSTECFMFQHHDGGLPRYT
jgi:hypothetical protein